MVALPLASPNSDGSLLDLAFGLGIFVLIAGVLVGFHVGLLVAFCVVLLPLPASNVEIVRAPGHQFQQGELAHAEGSDMRIAAVLVCLISAIITLLLLNGQTFTNALVALTLVVIALSVSAASALSRKAGKAERRRWRLTTLLMAVLAAYILATLPHAYRFQRAFNQERQRVRSLHLKAVTPGV
jgi:hypothetical protein